MLSKEAEDHFLVIGIPGEAKPNAITSVFRRAAFLMLGKSHLAVLVARMILTTKLAMIHCLLALLRRISPAWDGIAG